MKKIILLTAFISLSLLSGCKEKGPIESPTFSSFGKEITFEAFTVRRNSIGEVNPIANGATQLDASVPSFSYSSKSNYELETARTRKGDGGTLMLNDTTLNISQDYSGSFDSQNEAFAYVEK